MKNKFFLMILLFLFSSLIVESQTILKRNKLKKQLLRIDSMITAKQFERAINLFESHDKQIFPENVPKKYKALFDNICVVLTSKITAFTNTNKIVEDLKNEYISQHYCKAIELLNLNLNNENSYVETQKIKNSILSELNAAKEKCEGYTKKVSLWRTFYEDNKYESLYFLLTLDDSEKNYFFEYDLKKLNDLITKLKVAKTKTDEYAEKIKLWKKSFENKEYESIYYLLKFDEFEKTYFSQSDLKDFNELIKNLKEKYIIYTAVSEYLLNKTVTVVNKINYESLTKEQAKSTIDTLNANLILTDEKIKEAPGLNPELESSYKLCRENVEAAIEKLQKYIKEKKSTKIAIIDPLFSFTDEKGKNNKIKNDLSELNLKGKVKSITETTFDVMEKFGEMQNVEREKNVSLFNKSGNLTEMNSNTYKYDNKGNKIESKIYKNEDGTSYKHTYKYDDKGNIIEDNSYHSDGSLVNKDIYKYDDKGNKIEDNSYYPDGSLDSKWTYNYDDKGNQIESNKYTESQNYPYGRSVSESMTYKYDDKGNKIESQHNFIIKDGSLKLKSTYKYDDKGNIIDEDNSYRSDGNSGLQITYKYDYDITGNWIKKTEFRSFDIFGRTRLITEREIKYY